MPTAHTDSCMQLQYLDQSVAEVRVPLEKEYNSVQVCIPPMQPKGSLPTAAQCRGVRNAPK